MFKCQSKAGLDMFSEQPGPQREQRSTPDSVSLNKCGALVLTLVQSVSLLLTFHFKYDPWSYHGWEEQA